MGYNRGTMSNTNSIYSPIRALFVDMDGTMIGPDERVSPAVCRAIQAAHTAGCTIIPCTGRTRFTAQPIAEQLGIPLEYAITANGAVAQHLGREELLFCHHMPRETAQFVAIEVLNLGAQVYIYEDSVIYELEHSRAFYDPRFEVGPWATAPRYRPKADLSENLPFDPISVATFGKKAQIHPLVPTIEERIGGQVSLLQSGSEHFWGIEIYKKGVSKGTAAAWLVDHLGIAQEETLAIGDHLNDLDLIGWAGIGVAMHNAQPEVLAIADYVTTSVYEDGVARAIEKFILKPLHK
jgi:Cof subfamily protein (haloacid dehalogenase superfamily)